MRMYRYDMMEVINGLPFIKDDITSQFKSLLEKNNQLFMSKLRESGRLEELKLKPEVMKDKLALYKKK